MKRVGVKVGAYRSEPVRAVVPQPQPPVLTSTPRFRVRVYSLGCRFRIQGAGCRVPGAGCRVQGTGYRV